MMKLQEKVETTICVLSKMQKDNFKPSDFNIRMNDCEPGIEQTPTWMELTKQKQKQLFEDNSSDSSSSYEQIKEQVVSIARSSQNGLISDKMINANDAESSAVIASDDKDDVMDNVEKIKKVNQTKGLNEKETRAMNRRIAMSAFH